MLIAGSQSALWVPRKWCFAQRPLFHLAHLHLRSGAICQANRVILPGNLAAARNTTKSTVSPFSFRANPYPHLFTNFNAGFSREMRGSGRKRLFRSACFSRRRQPPFPPRSSCCAQELLPLPFTKSLCAEQDFERERVGVRVIRIQGQGFL